MIKWFSASRVKTVPENESPSQFTNDPLAAITGFGSPEGKCQIYAVSRVNPLFEEEKEEKNKESLKNTLQEAVDQSSPRKSISSGYESRFNSSSDSSSCTEYEDKHFQSQINGGKREKKLTKQTKTEKKKRTDPGPWEKNDRVIQDPHSNSINVKKKQRKANNNSPAGSSNLSPIPEGKIDCSIPPPVWPRFEEKYPENRVKNINVQVPGRLYHNGSTSPANYIFKYNESYANYSEERDQTLWNYIDKRSRRSYATSKEEYERNWEKCQENQYKDSSCFTNDEKSLHSEGSMEKLFESRKKLTREVLDDLANLIAYAMTKTNSLSLDCILKNLAESVQKSLEILAGTENDENLRILCENLNRNKYLNKLWEAVQCHDENYHISSTLNIKDSNKKSVSTSLKAHEQRKIIKKNRNVKEDLSLYRANEVKDEIYSSGSLSKNSSSSSSGCKDLYLSSNSSNVEKDVGSSNIEYLAEGVKPLLKVKKQTMNEESCKKNEEANEEGVINLIHHERDSSSSSTESAFGYSDWSTPISDSSSAQGVLNPVFLHENLYSMPKRVQNAIVCDSFDRTIDENHRSVKNCGSSAFEKLISAKRKISRSNIRIEEVGPLPYIDQEKPLQPSLMTAAKIDSTVLKKIEHPYYVAIGRPDFTLDLPQAEKLMKKIASSKRRRCWCRFMTPLLGLLFFLLSVMLVSLVVTKVSPVIYSLTKIALSYGAGFGFILLLHTAMERYRPDIVDLENRPETISLNQLKTRYDFIIVGAGSAGSVVANRLTENSNWTVLLVEAGVDETYLSEPPMTFRALQKSEMDWQFQTEPSQNFCLSMKEKRCNWPRGKIMGGSSTINGNIYVRGNKKDYDYWEELGNSGWGFQDVLKYFKKSENMTIDEFKNDPYHSTGGYLTIEEYRYHTPLARAFIEGAEELGYKIRDINGESQTGFCLPHGTLRNGLRCSASKAFIRPIVKRKNLHIIMETQVEKILIRKKTKQAIGILLNRKKREPRKIYADKEVILCAGAIQSPQLLMLSGIGPKEHLKKLRIPVVLDLKGVGENLQDHVAMGGSTYLVKEEEAADSPSVGFMLPKILNVETLKKFLFDQEGPLYCFPDIEVIGFVHTKFSNPEEDWPDIQIMGSTYAENLDGGIFSKKSLGLTDEYFARCYTPILFQEAFTITPLLLRPKSRGKILLKSNNPYEHPLIFPNYFEQEDDLRTLVEGMKIGDSLIQTTSLKKHSPVLTDMKIPGCEKYEKPSDDYYSCQARHHTMTIYHPVGTCKMGPQDDDFAVVNTKLQVRNISNLRVIDGSIMPTIVSGNTNAPIIMIGEKGSDLIKMDWEDKTNK